MRSLHDPWVAVDSALAAAHDDRMTHHSSPAFSTDFSDRIAPPSPDRPPLRVNAYEHAQLANTSLAPLFPYMQRGAIVPTTTLFVGSPDAEFGHFFHENTEEEVALVIADRNGIKGKGMVMIAPQLHGVQCFLKEPHDPESFLLIVITQRQNDTAEQKERVFFRCGCNNVLFERSYDATPADTYDPRANHVFLTTSKSAAVAIEYNSDETNRTCSKCGKVNPPFPHQAWGWEAHTTLHTAAADARRANVLAEAAR
jgi:hypothetical protein